MTEKVEHRARSRDRDQRMPTFQVLDHFHHNGLHPEAKHTEPHPPPHTTRKTSKSPTAARYDQAHLPVGRSRNNKDSPPTTARKTPLTSRFTSCSPNRRHELVSSNETIHGSCGSRQSISSGRGPACSFADQFYLHSSERSRSVSPKRGNNTCGSPERTTHHRQDEGGEEATDVLVWNTTKKSSRTNILCPLTDSERNVMSKQETRKGARGRSTSLPSSKRQKPCRDFSRSLLSLDDTCQTELIDNFLPPTLHEASSSVSFASSNDYEIAMVTQQLEQIQQAQNNILKQLGDEIALVHTENERLRKEVAVVREQNEKLHNLVKDMSAQLERMKQIFRTRGLPIPPSTEHIAASIEKTKKEVEEAPPTPLALTSDSSTSADDKLLPLAEQPPQDNRHKRRSQSRSKSPSKSKHGSESSKKTGHAHDQTNDSRNKSVKIAQPPHHEVGAEGESPETLEKLLTHHNPKVVEDFKNSRESFVEDGHNFEVEEYNDVVEKLWVDADTVRAPAETRTHRSRDSSAGSNKSHAHSPHRDGESSRSSKRSRDGKRAGEKPSVSSGIRTTESKDFKSESSIAKSVKVSKPKRRGCFGLFNFFWPSKAYAKDSEDEICE